MFDPPIDDAPSLDKLVNDIMDLQRENAALKADVASLHIAQQRKGETVRSCLTCGKFINCSTPLSNCGYDYWIPHTASPVA